MPLFCWFDHFLVSRPEICQISFFFFGKFKSSKRHSEINWPLVPRQKYKSLMTCPKSKVTHLPVIPKKNQWCHACIIFTMWPLSLSNQIWTNWYIPTFLHVDFILCIWEGLFTVELGMLNEVTFFIKNNLYLTLLYFLISD